MTQPVACSACTAHYHLAPGRHRAFCPACLDKINADARAAGNHMNAIRAGRMDTAPDNERQRMIRDDARRRQLNPASRDTKRSPS